MTQAGANPDDWNAEVPAGEAVADQEADVAVVGGGGAGLAAAIAAGQQGAKVVVIEKNAEVGGDTLVCGAIYNTPDEELQKEVTMTDAVKTTVEKALATEITSEDGKALQAEVQKQWDEYKKSGRTDLFDTKEWYALQTWLGGDQVANLDLVKVLCYNAYDGLQWIEDHKIFIRVKCFALVCHSQTRSVRAQVLSGREHTHLQCRWVQASFQHMLKMLTRTKMLQFLHLAQVKNL